MRISIESVVLDGETQVRVLHTDRATVERYADRMRAGDEFPAVVLFADSNRVLRVGDGHHRLEAARLIGAREIEATIRDGGEREAFYYSATSNSRNGLNLTTADKRRIIDRVIGDEFYADWSDRKIGDYFGVSHPFVGGRRRLQSGNVSSLEPIGGKTLTPEQKARLAELEANFPEGIKAATEVLEALSELEAMLGFEEVEDWLLQKFGQKSVNSVGLLKSFIGPPDSGRISSERN